MFEDAPSIWAAIVAGLSLIGLFWYSRWNYLALIELKALPAGTPIETPLDVTVIIPARNEARNIARAVQCFTPLCRVIVMDDDSSDGTAEKAREAGAEVFAAPPMRGQILGKPNACLAGFEQATTKWVLFVDADVECLPKLLPALLVRAADGPLDMVSLFLGRRHSTFLSAFLVPYAYAAYFTCINSVKIHSLKTTEALASGHCVLFTAAAYAFTGGHRMARNAVMDDMELGRLAKRHRLKFEIMRAEKLGRAHMYGSFVELWKGLRKGSVRLLSYNKSRSALPVLATVLPLAYLPILAWLWSQREERYVHEAMYAFATVPLWMMLPWYRNLFTLATPFTMYVFPLIAANAGIRWLLGLKDTWKGRELDNNNS